MTARGSGRLLARLGVRAGLLLLLLLFVARARMGRRLAEVQPGAVLIVIGLVTVDRLLMAWKWWLLVRGRDAAVSLRAAIRAYYLASFAGWFLPMTLGAD